MLDGRGASESDGTEGWREFSNGTKKGQREGGPESGRDIDFS